MRTVGLVRSVALGASSGAALGTVAYRGQGRTRLRFAVELHLLEQAVGGEERGVVVAGAFAGDVGRTGRGQFVALLQVRVQLADRGEDEAEEGRRWFEGTRQVLRVELGGDVVRVALELDDLHAGLFGVVTDELEAARFELGHKVRVDLVAMAVALLDLADVVVELSWGELISYPVHIERKLSCLLILLFSSLKIVVRLPSRIVPPIWPGWCSGMSITIG